MSLHYLCEPKQQIFGGVKNEQARQTQPNGAWSLSEMRPVLRPEDGNGV